MYSPAAIALYGELLKTAEAAVDEELSKEAGIFGPSLGGVGRMAGRMAENVAAHGGLSEAEAAARNVGRRSIMSGMSEADRGARARDLMAARKRMQLARDVVHGRGEFGSSAAAQVHQLDPESQAAVQRMVQQGQGGNPIIPRKGAIPGGPGAAPAAAPVAGGAPQAHPALSRAHMLGGAAALGATGMGAYGLGQHFQKNQDKTQRNIAFGAGTATGLALPGLLRGAANSAQNLSLSPASLFPRGY